MTSGARIRSLNEKLIALFSILSLCACSPSLHPATAPASNSANDNNANVFDKYLSEELPPADGFDFPFGRGDGTGSYTDSATGKQHDGWYIATRFGETYSLGIHPGEDWNGNGGGNTDLGQPVFAVANGRTVFAAHCGRL